MCHSLGGIGQNAMIGVYILVNQVNPVATNLDAIIDIHSVTDLSLEFGKVNGLDVLPVIHRFRCLTKCQLSR